MNKNLSSTEQSIIEKAREFAVSVIEPNAETWDHTGVPREYFLRAGAAGLCGLLVPRTLGGAELSFSGLAAVVRVLAASCFSSTFALLVHNNLAGNIARNGAKTHQSLLPEMIAGEAIGAFLLTEPTAGSDATAIETRAAAHDDGWEVSGQKAWVTNGAIADLMSVYVQTDVGSGAQGIANLLIDTRLQAVTRTARYELLGGHAMNTCGIEFRETTLPPEALMIEAGRAFRIAMQGIDLARMVVAAMCCGMVESSLDTALRRAKARALFGKTVYEFQAPQQLLADSATDLEAAWLLTRQAATELDNGERATLNAAHAKKFATQMALRRIADCMQVMGAEGALREYPLARHLAAAKLAQYVDGTTEIQNVVIARELANRAG